MNFNLYLSDQIGKQLNVYAEKQGITRNRLIREAIDLFIQKMERTWPEEILNFKGIPDFPAFELDRREFISPKEDPLA